MCLGALQLRHVRQNPRPAPHCHYTTCRPAGGHLLGSTSSIYRRARLLVGERTLARAVTDGESHIRRTIAFAHDMGANGRDPLYNADISEPVSTSQRQCSGRQARATRRVLDGRQVPLASPRPQLYQEGHDGQKPRCQTGPQSAKVVICHI